MIRARWGAPCVPGPGRVVVLHTGQSGAETGVRIMVKFIRMGDVPRGTFPTDLTMVIQTRLYEDPFAEPLRADFWLALTTLKIADPPSCRMRTQEVNMGTLSPASFSGVGSHAGQRSYDLVLDCEAGVGQVDYQVVPTTVVINSELGLAEASGGVGGVAYQFLNADGSPMRFYATDLFGHGGSKRGSADQDLRRAFPADPAYHHARAGQRRADVQPCLPMNRAGSAACPAVSLQ